jgi:phytoene dehydrogenase-like protein
MADYVDFLPIDPLFQVVDQDGKRFEIPTSPEETGRIFASISEEDGEGWRRFSHAAETGMAQAMTALFTTPMQTFADAREISRRFPSMSGDRSYMLKSFESTLRSRVVIGDVNAQVIYGRFLPREVLPRWARLAVRGLPLSQSSAMLLLGLEGGQGFGGHHTLFSTGLEPMNRIWFDDYERGRPSRGGYLLASMPSATDASLAPRGHHVVHLHTLAPYALAGGQSWDDIREAEAERMLDFLERDFGVQLRDRIRFMRLSTPIDLERDVGLHRGALYGLENSLFSTSMFRPRMRSAVIDKLYLAGSSVHLGGGIPPCLGSGMIAANMVTEDWGKA